LVRRLIVVHALVSLIVCGTCIAQSPKQINQGADPLVRSLEALYAKSMEVALTGDLDAYWRLRTTGSRDRPPMLTRERLPLFARMLPPLDSLSFVRLDTTGKMARALYRWPRADMTRYTVIVYLLEQGAWRIDSILVKTDPVSNPREAEMMEKLRRRAQDAAASQ
jgi:hypothetical protein